MPKETSFATSPYHHRHIPNVSFVFCAGYIGHSTEDYLVFKVMVQELID